MSFFMEYLGCAKIMQSTKDISKDSRDAIAKEVVKLCTSSSACNKKFNHLIGNVNREQTGMVEVSISKEEFTIKSIENQEIIALHAKSNISFVALFSEQKPHYFTYCARDRTGFRALYVAKVLDIRTTEDLRYQIDRIFNQNLTLPLPQPKPGISRSKSFADMILRRQR